MPECKIKTVLSYYCHEGFLKGHDNIPCLLLWYSSNNIRIMPRLKQLKKKAL